MGQRITGGTQLAAVIGSPIRHSLSPVILNAAFAAAELDWVFVAFEVGDGDAPAALDGMRALDIRGLSVTMPHKEAVFRALDRVSDDARALQAVNCVVNDDGTLAGESTDGPGFIDSLAAAGFDARGTRAVVLGAGGAARAIVLALARAGVADVAVINRTREKAEVAAALAGEAGRVVEPAGAGANDALAAADLVVNATSVGMHGDELPVAVDQLHAGQVVADAVYDPLETALLRAAAAVGATTVDGLGMLVHQAAHSFRRWTGIEAPLDAMTAAVRRPPVG